MNMETEEAKYEVGLNTTLTFFLLSKKEKLQ